MKTIVWLNPTSRDKRELQRLQSHQDMHIIYHTYASESMRRLSARQQKDTELTGCRMPCDEIAHLASIVSDMQVDGIGSSRDYPSGAIVTAIAQQLGLSGPSVESNLLSQHKYHTRRILDAYVPEINPPFELLTYDTLHECTLTPPYIIKPIKAMGSVGMHYIQAPDDIAHINDQLPYGFFQPFDQLLQTYTAYDMPEPQLIAEAYTEGHQVTLDGFVCNGNIHMLGIVDSHFYPNTLSFYKFDYPSQLPDSIQQRMFAYATQCIQALGLDNLVFNIEFLYNEEYDIIRMIEINPRMSSQFSTLYEKVDNINVYHIALEIACGNEPTITRGAGTYNNAASFALRTFTDYYIHAVPTASEQHIMHQQYPDASLEICCQSGKYLSELYQDAYSYLYAIINVGGNSEEETEAICSDIQALLTFSCK